jgi:hypothetical protein
MSISHFRLSKLEQKVGISATKMFIFSAPCAYGGQAEFAGDDFTRLVGRERQQGDLIVVLKQFYDPADPDSKATTSFGSPTSEVTLMSAADLKDEARRSYE